jgi:sugar phosphate isomerase/epimerase
MKNAVAVQNEIRSNLMKAGKSCFVDETFVNLAQAKELICQLGGIPCYPTLADGSSQRCEYETPLDTLIDNLKANGYTMAEFIPLRNQPDVLSEYVKAIRDAGIVVVAGTEHNTLDLVPIAPTCVDNQEIPEDVNDIFFEGVCVLAGHAFLTAHGQGGFVDESNKPNPNYSSDEERIADFRNIGAAVLARYFQK